MALVLVCLVGEAIISFGASIWLLEKVTKLRIFSYSLLAYVFVFVLLLITIGVIRSQILKDDSFSVIFRHVFEKITNVLAIMAITIVALYFFDIDRINGFLSYKIYKIISCNLRGGNEHALGALNEAISYNETNPSLYIERGDLYLEMTSDDTIKEAGLTDLDSEKCVEYAIINYTWAIDYDKSKNRVGYYKRAKAYSMAGLLWNEEACDDYLYALELSQGQEWRIDCLLSYGKHLIDSNPDDDEVKKEALYYIEQAIDESEEASADMLLYRGIAYSRMDVEIAIDSISKSLELNENELGINTRALFYAESTDERALRKAIEDFDRASRMTYENVDYLYRMASAYYQLGTEADMQRAVSELKKLAKRAPLRQDIKRTLGWAYNAVKQYDNAYKVFDDLVAIDATNASYYRSKADVSYNNGMYERAIDNYRECMQIDGKYSAYCKYSIGQSYYRLKEYESARENLASALNEGLNDQYKESCFYELGQVCYYLKEYDAARDAYEQALRWCDENNEERILQYEYELGNVLYYLEEYQGAIEAYSSVVNAEEGFWAAANCYYFIGTSYWYLGDQENAIANMEKAIQIKPEEDWIKWLKSIKQ